MVHVNVFLRYQIMQKITCVDLIYLGSIENVTKRYISIIIFDFAGKIHVQLWTPISGTASFCIHTSSITIIIICPVCLIPSNIKSRWFPSFFLEIKRSISLAQRSLWQQIYESAKTTKKFIALYGNLSTCINISFTI